MDYDTIRRDVIDWLDDNYHFGEAAALLPDDHASLLDRGVLESLGFVQLIVHLENTYGIRIDRQALSRDNFDSLAKIARHVLAHPDLAPPS